MHAATRAVLLALIAFLPLTTGRELPALDDVTDSGLHISLDADRDGIDDGLAGAVGDTMVYLHYDDYPDDDDAAALDQRGVNWQYRFITMPIIKVEVDAARFPDILATPGVTGIEQVHEATPEHAVSTAAIRARAATGVVDDVDHTLSAHDTLGIDGTGMVVAIIDSGVNNDHESLDDLDDDPSTHDPKLLTGAYAGSSSVDGCIDPDDSDGHGTHVAGTAVGTGGPSGTYRGVAPGAKMVDIQIGSIPMAFDWVVAFNQGNTCFGDPGEDRIDVVSISYGFGTENPYATVSVAATGVVQAGVTLVISAGNSGSGQGTLTKGPEGAILVASSYDAGTITRTDDSVSTYSSRGPRTQSDDDQDPYDDLYPTIAAPGEGIMSADDSGSGYVSLSGTSMAAPHIGGLAALILQADPTLRPVAGNLESMGNAGSVPVRDLLIESAHYRIDTGNTAAQVEYVGQGGNLWNNAWGYGYADAYTAVYLALNDQLPPFACYTIAGSLMDVTLDASCGNAAGVPHWDFGDGNTATGTQVSHTFATAGDHEVTLTVQDPSGDQTATRTVFTRATTDDPDPATPTVQPGQVTAGQANAIDGDDHYKVFVPHGESRLNIEIEAAISLSTPAAGFEDFDLYAARGRAPTDNDYDCRPYTSSGDESCVFADPAGGWWYIRVAPFLAVQGDYTLSVTFDAPLPPGTPVAVSDPWVTLDDDGYCQAIGAVVVGDHYVHERNEDGLPPGTAFVSGGGTWIYEEGNGLPGLQVGGAGESAQYADCPNPDVLIF